MQKLPKYLSNPEYLGKLVNGFSEEDKKHDLVIIRLNAFRSLGYDSSALNDENSIIKNEAIAVLEFEKQQG